MANEFQDLFTGTGLLENHTSDSAHTWVKSTRWPGGQINVQNGEAQGNSDATFSGYLSSYSMPTKGRLRWSPHYPFNYASNDIQVLLFASNDGANFYYIHHTNDAGGDLTIGKSVAGTNSDIVEPVDWNNVGVIIHATTVNDNYIDYEVSGADLLITPTINGTTLSTLTIVGADHTTGVVGLLMRSAVEDSRAGVAALEIDDQATADVTAPVLSNPTKTIGQTTVTPGITTDEACDVVPRVYADGATPLDAEVIAGTGAIASSASVAATVGANVLNQITGLTAGTPYELFFWGRDAASNDVVFQDPAGFTTATADTTAPILTGPGESHTDTTVTGTVSTDEAGGTLWKKVYAAATVVDKAGFYAGSPAPVAQLSKTATVGANNFGTLGGLVESTDYKAVLGHIDSAGNQAEIVEVAFTTNAAVDTLAPTLTFPNATVYPGSVSLSFVTNEGGLGYWAIYADTVNLGTAAQAAAIISSAIPSPAPIDFNNDTVVGGLTNFPLVTGLPVGTPCTAYFTVKDAAGNLADAVSVNFTPEAAAGTGDGATAADVLALLVSQDYASTVAASVYAELTAQGLVAKVDGLTTGADTADAVYAKLEAMSLITKIDETWKMQGLDPNDPLVVTRQSRVSGDINQLISGDGRTLGTVTRQP